jgi:hypothetical protein
MTFIDTLHDELLAVEGQRDRALQTEAGASQTEGCRAELVMLGNGIPESDPRLGWAAWVGNAIHERLASQLAKPGRELEKVFVYRGVPATVDRYDAETKTLVDYKTKGSAGDIAAVRRDGPRRGQIAQVMIGAAGLIEAGHPVETVGLIFVPRDGELEDSWPWFAPYDQSIADEAAEWHEKLRALTAERAGLDVEQMVDGLRDKPPSFCRMYCPRVTLCRGPEVETPLLDEGIADVAAEYMEAVALEAEGKARKSKARTFLIGRNGTAGEFKVTTSGGNTKTEDVIDDDALRDLWGFVNGEQLPTKPIQTTSAVSLRVSKPTPKTKPTEATK